LKVKQDGDSRHMRSKGKEGPLKKKRGADIETSRPLEAGKRGKTTSERGKQEIAGSKKRKVA